MEILNPKSGLLKTNQHINGIKFRAKLGLSGISNETKNSDNKLDRENTLYMTSTLHYKSKVVYKIM